MGFIIFKGGIYKAKSKEESDIMSAFISDNMFYKEEKTEDDNECLYVGMLKNLSPEYVSFELKYYLKDFDKFKHLTLAELMESYEIPK